MFILLLVGPTLDLPLTTIDPLQASKFDFVSREAPAYAIRCTTANVDKDHSNYWVPQLYHKNDNDSLSLSPFDFAQT